MAIAAGTRHSLVLKTDGSIVGWGISDGSSWDYGQVTDTPGGNDFVAVAAGAWHNLALKSDGSIVGWGWDDYGQATPPEGNNFMAIAAHYRHSLALKGADVDINSDGKVDFIDFSLLAQWWMQHNSPVEIAPIPLRDGIVDFKDLALLRDNWLIEPPGQASNPNPADETGGVGINADLSWTAGSDAASHDVYFGMTSPPPFVRNQSGITFDPGTMAYTTTYYWRIDEVNLLGTTTGTVWSFTTGGIR